ncbi:hypothetical protein ERJ75_000830300 [Trypanosoma vivax]|uniref:Putative 3' exoribonuclease n=1 Tax=Trypanosoma vivax (strain Y486) TaxID=1055687 RepID=G0TZ24_TRYVY|nr:hypothetical protein ERJ75_000830300 [Trypanosoma vivax]CCC49227.1 putative 3' exoribonuclease [Trypanosoma vivax Y486]
MEFDEDILPLMQKMDGVLTQIQEQLLPLFSLLSEDVLVSNYGVDEQARISLAAAFVLLLVTYAHDALTNRPNGAGMDKQLMLKINRVTEYIGKLREITLLDSESRQAKGMGEGNKGAGESEGVDRPMLVTGDGRGRKTDRDASARSDKHQDTQRNRRRLEADGETRPSASSAIADEPGAAEDGNIDPLGDGILFKEVERVPGKTSVLVRNLLRQVKGTDIDEND